MRYLIIADVHANIEALTAVLDAERNWDQLLVLGDLVGYGAAPNEVVDRIRGLDPVAVIRGNHDKAACGIEDGSNFNQVARLAAVWTHETLTPGNRQYLRELPAGPEAIDEHLEICHGTPFDEEHYILDGEEAQRALSISHRQRNVGKAVRSNHRFPPPETHWRVPRCPQATRELEIVAGRPAGDCTPVMQVSFGGRPPSKAFRHSDSHPS